MVGADVAAARAGTRTSLWSRDPGFATLVALSLFAAFVFVGLLLYAAQFSGTARWIAGVLLVALLAVLGTYAVVRRTSRPEPLAPAVAGRDVREGELSALTDLADRAARGMAFSQSLLVGRVRDAFAERVRLQRGLAPETMRALEEDLDGLRAAVRDEGLAVFLHETRDRDGRDAWAYRARRGEGFDVAVRDLLDRMEAWR